LEGGKDESGALKKSPKKDGGPPEGGPYEGTNQIRRQEGKRRRTLNAERLRTLRKTEEKEKDGRVKDPTRRYDVWGNRPMGRGVVGTDGFGRRKRQMIYIPRGHLQVA
jgi:hypothetical protein